ncbi:hypothetical protein BDR05DRAFT_431682 [Suillus weaverae]|nr:hypothetical protein BDR05DRAFT_431682 [Suillus weaverae]
MKAQVGFLSLAEELQFYILSFLTCRDILRCTSVCKALRQTYTSSSELQYIIELSGQRLLPVPNAVDHTSISKRLQLLRDKAHAWFKFNLHSFETVSLPEELSSVHTFVADGHLCSWEADEHSAVIFPILPKPSRRQVKRDWSPGTLCSAPHATNLDVFMDPAQNLLAVVYAVPGGPLQSDETVYIDLRALDGDSVHPQAAGRTLILSELLGFNTNYVKLKGFEKHIALLRRQHGTPIALGTSSDRMWQLQIWDWQNSTASNCVLSDTFLDLHYEVDISFLGNNRLLVVTDNLKLYLIEDMSQTPQLLAYFLLPFTLPNLECLPMDDIQHSSEPQMQVPQMMYTSDPKNRLLCITSSSRTQVFIISTRIFFDLDGMAGAMPIPWTCWGPSNTRIFRHADPCSVHVSGNRVLQAFPVHEPYPIHTEYILHLMDFSPLAVANRRGLGRVVKELSTIATDAPRESLTTSLPYVEVVLDRKFGSDVSELDDIWADKDRIYLLNANWERGDETCVLCDTPQSRWLEVVDV